MIGIIFLVILCLIKMYISIVDLIVYNIIYLIDKNLLYPVL